MLLKKCLDYYSSDSVAWDINNTNIATVTNGLVKSVASGTTTITVSSPQGMQTTCPVTVENVRNHMIMLTQVS